MTTEIEGLSVTPTEKRWSWKSSVKSSTPTELKSPSDSERSKRWSYASNSSHAYEKVDIPYVKLLKFKITIFFV